MSVSSNDPFKFTCDVCDKEDCEKGETFFDIGTVCQDCLDSAENKTGHCSMSCQLFGNCDGSC